MNILHAIGLLTRAEHERLMGDLDDKAFQSWNKLATERDDLYVKFKRAATDLAAQADELAGLQRLANGLNAEIEKLAHDRDAWQRTATTYAEELATARPDAQRWRDRAEHERQRGERRKVRT